MRVSIMPPNDVNISNGWNRHEELVLSELRRLNITCDKLTESIQDLRIATADLKQNREDVEQLKMDMVAIKTKAALLGGLGGLIVGAVVTALVEFGLYALKNIVPIITQILG